MERRVPFAALHALSDQPRPGRACWRRALNGALAASLIVGAARPAPAADAHGQAAEALFRQAKSRLESGNLREACEKFSASQALEPGVGTLLYLGDCYERSARFASAWSTFTDARALARSHADHEREHLASVRAAALEPRVPRLVIQSLAVQPAGLQITVNGSPIERSDLDHAELRDAGSYEISFRAPGYEPFTTRIELTNGQARPVVVAVPQLVELGSSEPRDARAPAAEAGSTQRTLAWVLGGTGVALGVGAGVFALVASGKNTDSKADCSPANPNRCSPRGVAERKDARSWASAATIASVAGAVSLVGGVVLYVSAPSNEAGVPDSAFVNVAIPLL
jgi:hypothetical protein